MSPTSIDVFLAVHKNVGYKLRRRFHNFSKQRRRRSFFPKTSLAFSPFSLNMFRSHCRTYTVFHNFTKFKIKTGVLLFGTLCSTFLLRRYRFDCGTGAGRARTDNSVLLGRWNVIHIRRHGRSGWIQLNDGPRSLVRSKVCVGGLFSVGISLKELGVRCPGLGR